MGTRIREGLSEPTQSYFAVPYLFPSPHTWCNQNQMNIQPLDSRYLHLRPLQSCVVSAFISSEEGAGADVLGSEASDNTELCLCIQTLTFFIHLASLTSLAHQKWHEALQTYDCCLNSGLEKLLKAFKDKTHMAQIPSAPLSAHIWLSSMQSVCCSTIPG